jgi:hypothetical protein
MNTRLWIGLLALTAGLAAPPSRADTETSAGYTLEDCKLRSARVPVCTVSQFCYIWPRRYSVIWTFPDRASLQLAPPDFLRPLVDLLLSCTPFGVNQTVRARAMEINDGGS